MNCPSRGFKLSLGSNLLCTFCTKTLRKLGDLTHFLDIFWWGGDIVAPVFQRWGLNYT